jgi:transcriptional regulator with XRE-family HTH domain
MKKTIGEAFGELRTKSRMTMLAIGNRCGISESAVSKIERDKPVRWETVHLALSVGMNIQPGSADYQACHLLWLKQRAEKAEAHAPDFASKTLPKHGVEATRKFRQLIAKLNPAQTKRVLAAATRAAMALK